MQCPHCKAEDQEGHFCRKCGKPLGQDAGDMTRVMPSLNTDALSAPATENEPEDSAPDTSPETQPNDSAAATEQIHEDNAADAELQPTADTNADSADQPAAANDTDTEKHKPELPPFLLEKDAADEENELPAEEKEPSRRKTIIVAAAMIVGIVLAAAIAIYLFTDIFGNGKNAATDPSEQVKSADTVTPDTSLAEDTIVGHWRHYNDGSVIEKIGSGSYRWTIGDNVYQLDFDDNSYTYEDESGNTYIFVLTDSDHIQLASASDSSGGLISNPVFETGYIAGRVGQDGTMSKSLSVNADAFNIIGKTYAELAGTYGPGALTVVGDTQYIVFRGEGGNFAVQFSGETVPLSAEATDTYSTNKLSAAQSQSYSVVRMTSTTTPHSDQNGTGNDSTTTTDSNENNNTSTTTDDNTAYNNSTTVNGGSTTTTPSTNTEESEDTEYTVEIPDMPTFPSTTAVASGVVWADLGFVVNNATTMSVADLSAVFGIAFEVGSAPSNQSGFNFYGSDEGYFAGTYTYGDHSFYVSGYGNSALKPDKTTIFIQQLS